MIEVLRVNDERWNVRADTLQELAWFHLTTDRMLEDVHESAVGWFASVGHNAFFRRPPDAVPATKVTIEGATTARLLLSIRHFATDLKAVERELQRAAAVSKGKRGAR